MRGDGGRRVDRPPDDPLVLVAGVGQAGPALLHVRRAQPVGRHRRLHYGPATHRGTHWGKVKDEE